MDVPSNYVFNGQECEKGEDYVGWISHIAKLFKSFGTSRKAATM